MKAPELPTKIYFTVLDMGSGYVYTPSLEDNGGTEYIRKDALMEWAKETYLNENASAIRKVCYKQLIDKLNSI